MATLISNADGDFTGASTFAGAETGASALAMIRANTTTLSSAATVTSPTFTITNGKTIDGVLLWIGVEGVAGTGTFKIDLQKGGVSQASVTVNKSDLPATTLVSAFPVPVFFKFTGTAAGDGGSNWTLVATTVAGTGSAIVRYYRNSATTGDFTRALRTTTAATIAVNDNWAVIGELTGAGTFNRRKVDMDHTATTVFGNGTVETTSVYGGVGIISHYGNLAYKYAGSTNYLLTLAADLILGFNGILDICQTSVFTVTIATPGVFTLNSHGFENGRRMRLRTTGALPTNLSAGVDYYVVNASTNTFELSLTVGGASIATGGSQSGTHTLMTGCPRNSTMRLKFQPVSLSTDFGIKNWGGTINHMGLSRTVGKEIDRAMLTSNVTAASVINNNSTSGTTVTANAALDHTGMSLRAATVVESTANALHTAWWSSPSVSNTTQTAIMWVARGTGTNNRYLRLTMGNSTAQGSVTNGFYCDFDLQAGTAGTPTAVGNGTATSVSIVAFAGGYVLKLTGKVSSGAATANLLLNVCSAPGTLTFAGSNTTAFIIEDVAIVTAASIADTTVSISQDTGWLNNDVAVVAGTNGQPDEQEAFRLNADAGSSSFTSPHYPFGYFTGSFGTGQVALSHGSAANRAAEVILLTRNVSISSTNPAIGCFVFNSAEAVFTAWWAEYAYIGSTTSQKRGVEFQSSSATAGAKHMSYCSVHDATSIGIYISSSNQSVNMSLLYNVVFNSTSQSVAFAGDIALGDYVIDHNIVMGGASYQFDMQDGLRGQFTWNVMTGGTGTAQMRVSQGSGVSILGLVSDNLIHSGTQGIAWDLVAKGDIINMTVWRCSSYGVSQQSSTCQRQVRWVNPVISGCNSTGLTRTNWIFFADCLNILGGQISGETGYDCQVAIYIQSGIMVRFNINNTSFNPGGIYTAPTNRDFYFVISNTLIKVEGVCHNVKLSGAPLVIEHLSGISCWTDDSWLSFEKFNQQTGDHRTYMRYGLVQTDSSIVDGSGISARMTPNSASNKLPSGVDAGGILVPVVNGVAGAIAARVRKSVVGDGAAYNGNQPRLVQKANPALGQNADVVLATYSQAAGSWNDLTGTTSTPTDDGAFEIVLEVDGTAGWVNATIAA